MASAGRPGAGRRRGDLRHPRALRHEGSFVEELFVKPNSLGDGSVWDISFSPDEAQTWMYLADGQNMAACSFNIKVKYDTKQLYGKVTASRQIVIYKD